MKINYDQQIWKLCGSPTKLTCGNCIEYDDRRGTCAKCNGYAYEMKIEITLAHVMRLLAANNIHYQTIHPCLEYCLFSGCYDKDGERLAFQFNWRYRMSNNEAAPLRDQSEETQRTILEVVGNG